MRIFGFRPALWPTLFTIPAMITLLWLGTWQVERLLWKRDLLATMQAGLAAPAVDLPADIPDPSALNYRRVKLRGVFDHSREFHLLAHSERGNFGYQILVPLRRTDGPGWVLVNRGWVPPELKVQESRAGNLPAGEVAVSGVVRLPWGKGYFTPDNDLKANLWFHADVAGMLEVGKVAPAPLLFVEQDGTPHEGAWPRGGQTRVSLPNNHLAYAVTWYSGAVVLGVIYVLWHRRRRHEA